MTFKKSQNRTFMSQDMAWGGRKKCLKLQFHKRFILDLVKSSSHGRQRWDLLIHVCIMIHSAGQTERLKARVAPPEAEHSDRAPLPILETTLSRSHQAYLNWLFSTCFDPNATSYSRPVDLLLQAQLIEAESKQAAHKQTRSPDWLAAVLQLCGL